MTIRGFSGEVVTSADPRYEDLRRIWNGTIDRRPRAIARCATAQDVVAAIRHARDEGLDFSVRGGGHGVGGLCIVDDALLIDLAPMNTIAVDAGSRIVRAGAGVVLGELDRATQSHALAVPIGINTTTGLSGLTLGGGIGWLMRKHGLTIDSLLEVEMVTADGDIVRASDGENPELLWAIKGAGTNFGVVTSFTYRAEPVGPTVLAGPLIWAMEDAPDVLRYYEKLSREFPDELTTIAALRQAPPAPWLPEEMHGRHIVQIAACFSGAVENGAAALADLRHIRGLLYDGITPRPFLEVQSFMDASVPKGWHYYWKSHDLGALDEGFIDIAVDHSLRITSPRSYSLLPMLGGAVSRVDEDATAYSHREATHAININAVWLDNDPEPQRHIDWVRGMFAALEPYSAGVYLNFLGDEGLERVRAAYGPAKHDRLAGLKNVWDPANVFHHNQNIAPSVPHSAR